MARVLLLTAPEQARDLAFLLEEEGLEPCFLPVLGASTPLSAGLRAVAEQLQRFSWVVALHPGPVRGLLEAINQSGTRDRLTKVQWIAGDAPTARMLERQGALVRVPGDGKWTSALSGLVTEEDDVLVLHEGALPELLADALDATQARATFVEVPVTQQPALSAPAEARAVIVHSAAVGEAWAALTLSPERPPSESCCGPGEAHTHAARLEVPAGLKLVAGSPRVAEALDALGVPVHEVAREPSADAVLEATLRALGGEVSPPVG